MLDTQTFHASISHLPEMLTWIQDIVYRSSCPELLCMKLIVAIEEAVVNIVTYAYDDNHRGNIEISYELIPKDRIIIILKDWGKEFNPTLSYVPVKEVPLEKREVGGLGIPFMMEIMDQIEYRRHKDANLLQLVKYI